MKGKEEKVVKESVRKNEREGQGKEIEGKKNEPFLLIDFEQVI